MADDGKQIIGFSVSVDYLANLISTRILEVLKQAKPEKKDEYLTIKQVEKLLKISRTTIYRWRNKGLLVGKTIKGIIRFNRRHVEELFESEQPK